MDPIDQAIRDAGQAVRMTQLSGTISSTGRPFAVAFPDDLTEAELFEVVGWLATGYRQRLRQRTAGARPGPRILVPS